MVKPRSLWFCGHWNIAEAMASCVSACKISTPIDSLDKLPSALVARQLPGQPTVARAGTCTRKVNAPLRGRTEKKELVGSAPFPCQIRACYRGQNGSLVPRNSTAVACRSVRSRNTAAS